jgi:hypothetical protein
MRRWRRAEWQRAKQVRRRSWLRSDIACGSRQAYRCSSGSVPCECFSLSRRVSRVLLTISSCIGLVAVGVAQSCESGARRGNSSKLRQEGRQTLCRRTSRRRPQNIFLVNYFPSFFHVRNLGPVVSRVAAHQFSPNLGIKVFPKSSKV